MKNINDVRAYWFYKELALTLFTQRVSEADGRHSIWRKEWDRAVHLMEYYERKINTDEVWK